MTGTLKESTSHRGRRKSTYVAGSVVLFVVALALAIAGKVIGARALFAVAVGCTLLALVLIILGRRAAHHSPPHDEDHAP